jgi:DNA polymerase (family 10)
MIANQEIADVFRRLANLMELGDENPFKIRAYRSAADTIEDTTTPLAEMVEAGGVSRLRELPGVGEAISKKIVELIETGTFKAYEEIKAKIPETTLDLLKVDGVGIKTLQILHRQFQLTNLDDFAKFVAGGGLNSVPNLGEKTSARIRASIARLQSGGDPIHSQDHDDDDE